MSRLDSNAFGDKSQVLVFIAGNIREAERVEAVLTAAEIDYCLEGEEFTQGLLSSTRTGLGFYVNAGQASLARSELARAELHSGIVETDA
jgi:hypothetical protein